MTYAELCETWTRNAKTGELKELEVRLTILRTGDSGVLRFVENLEKHECRLELDTWEALAEALVSEPADLKRLCAAVQRVFANHLFRGGKVLPVPRLLGRVTSQVAFQGMLDKQYDISPGPAFDSLLGRIQADADQARAELESIYLVRPGRVMWATFDPVDDSRDPFANDDTAERSWSRLGLADDLRDVPLLLFVYSLPTSVEPTFPTVVEACAAPEQFWNPKFRPAPMGHRCGKTETVLPRDTGAPEVVHPAITGATLQERVRQPSWT